MGIKGYQSLVRSVAFTDTQTTQLISKHQVLGMRADELLEAGDIDGQVTWLRIIKAVEELLSQAPQEHDANEPHRWLEGES